MIGWDDIYKVVIAMFPLYVALILGYGSVKWWHMFKPDHCDSINRLNCYFIMPFFTFEFTTCIDPYKFNYRFAVADAISKVIILFAISLWTKFSINGNYPWSITTFSLSTLNNTLIVGVPLMRAMYGSLGENLAIQSSILQFLFWIILLLLMYEFQSANKRLCLDVDRENDNISEEETMTGTKPSSLILMKIVGLKLAKNPNSYACILGLTWALVSNRAGSGVAMFCMGLFMALQDKIIECGVTLAVFGMLLRFVAAPATMAVGSLVAALPQAITAFTYAKEYDLHANVLSTAVIFGTILSIPVLVAYYVVLDVLNV
ncbi:Auxin efflux carrier [Cynara cardunculus var. scolymus]|uniref:Auxin efflux carrier n=1 Tax=Cynara cardunculus var. scolymus TaxID=59895 RepID=A0A103XBN5_CYNCS|nr:Auxin efflux carrier [Cynara cardunculus var. scolymus]